MRSRKPTKQDIERALRSSIVWDRRPISAPAPSPEKLCAAADDRGDAVRLVAEILPARGRGAWFRLANERRFQSIGVVQELLARAAAAREENPIDACEVTQFALYLADRLDDSPAAFLVRGFARKELANTFMMRGWYDEALQQLDDAATVYERVHANGIEIATVILVRAVVLQRMGRASDALPLLSECIPVFREYGDKRLYLQARLLEGMISYSHGEFEAMHSSQHRVLLDAREAGDLEIQARLHNNLGHCCRALGREEEAAEHFLTASALFRELRMFTEIPRLTWAAARIRRDRGEWPAAITLFAKTRRDFMRVGLAGDADTVSLELIELLVETGDFEEAARYARPLPKRFAERGSIDRAIEAATYVREITRHRRATPAKIRVVRDYLRELVLQPDLVFRPPENG
jgi:tetratricopeptide (TPR) repeat protein